MADTPDATFVQCIGVQDPDVRRVLLDLARRLGVAFPTRGVRVLADVHECFDRVLGDPRWRGVTFADVQRAITAPPAVLDIVPEIIGEVTTAPHTAYNGIDALAEDLARCALKGV